MIEQKVPFKDGSVRLLSWRGGGDRQLPILALHGFVGGADDYEPVAERIKNEGDIYAIDLWGHGGSFCSINDSKKELCFVQIEMIQCVIEYLRLEEFILMGYSLGGRLALQYAVRNPSLLAGIVLIGSSPGIELTDEREKRVLADTLRAEQLIAEGIDIFLKEWQHMPLIETQKNIPIALFQSMQERRRKQKAFLLARAIQGFCPGILPSLWQKLNTVKCPCMLVAGEYDKKYQDIVLKMGKALSHSSINIVPVAGHMAHLENLEGFMCLFQLWMRENTSLCLNKY